MVNHPGIAGQTRGAQKFSFRTWLLSMQIEWSCLGAIDEGPPPTPPPIPAQLGQQEPGTLWRPVGQPACPFLPLAWKYQALVGIVCVWGGGMSCLALSFRPQESTEGAQTTAGKKDTWPM